MPVSFSKEVDKFLHIRLASLGFEKRKMGIMTIKISDDFLGWIGFNKATRGLIGAVEVNPVVGVRNQRIEELVAELMERKVDKVIPATLAGNIGYMMPANKYTHFFFSRDASLEPAAQVLVQDVRDYGLPFIREHSEMSALVQGLRTSRFAIDYLADYRIPVALFLLNKMDEVEANLDATLKKTGDRQDAAASQYKLFAANLARRLQSRPKSA